VEFLPTSEQQAWLVDSLAELLRIRGTHPFFAMPLVEPTSSFFPDRWTSPYEGLDRVTRRLMQYAGLSELDVKVGTFTQEEMPFLQDSGHHHSIAGAFLGIAERCCHFAFNEAAAWERDHLLGTMAHEVAHAYRAHHGLVRPGVVDEEEWLTDVTAAYLGFGILVANNSYRYRTSGGNIGVLSFHRWSIERVGYLSSQAFAYLLAIQMEARLLDPQEQQRLLKHLEANQAAFVSAALERRWSASNSRRRRSPRCHWKKCSRRFPTSIPASCRKRPRRMPALRRSMQAGRSSAWRNRVRVPMHSSERRSAGSRAVRPRCSARASFSGSRSS